MENDAYDCNICGKRFINKDFLAKHKKMHTKHQISGDKKFSCDICGKQFIWNSQLINHKIMLHTGDTKFSCDICHKSFKRIQDLDFHKSKKECSFKICEICQRNFKNEDFLNSHKIRDHNINDCDLQGLSTFVDCSQSLEWKIKVEDFKQEIKEEVIDDEITPFVDCGEEGIKEEVKEEFIV